MSKMVASENEGGERRHSDRIRGFEESRKRNKLIFYPAIVA